MRRGKVGVLMLSPLRRYVEGSDPQVSCKDQCQSTGEQLCCIGGNGEPPYDGDYYDACGGFTGKICPDGSCNGTSVSFRCSCGFLFNPPNSFRLSIGLRLLD